MEIFLIVGMNSMPEDVGLVSQAVQQFVDGSLKSTPSDQAAPRFPGKKGRGTRGGRGVGGGGRGMGGGGRGTGSDGPPR